MKKDKANSKNCSKKHMEPASCQHDDGDPDKWTEGLPWMRTEKPGRLSPDDIKCLIQKVQVYQHELYLHQMNLELQNEELRSTQQQLEESRDRYSDLYDFAPVGYFSFDKNGLILELNLTGALQLGLERAYLINTPFSPFIDRDERRVFYEHLQQVVKTNRKQTCEVKVIKKHGDPFNAHLESMAVQDSEGNFSQCRTTISDITKRKLAEEELRKAHDDLEIRVEERTHDLGERLKELNCLYSIGHLAERPNISLEEIIQGTVELIPTAWQYPEITCGRIVLQDREFKTENFKETVWNLACGITMYGDRIGSVEVCYLKEKPQSDDGPFLKEERSLVNAIAEWAGRMAERDWAEKSLRESENRYSSIFNNKHAVMLLIDPDTAEIVDANPAACSFYGYTSSELTAKKITDINGLSNEQVFQEMEQARSGHQQLFLFQHRLASGETRSVEIYKGPIIVNGKELMYAIVHDITDRKRAEEELNKYRHHLEDMVEERTSQLTAANEQLRQEIVERRQIEKTLRESEERYSSLVEQAKDGVVIIQNEALTFANKAVAEMSGYTIEELTDRAFLDIVAPDFRELVIQIYELSLAGEKVPSLHESGIQCKDGTIKDVEVSTGVIQYTGNPAVMAVIRDVTEHKKMEQEIQRAQKLESIGILAGGIAHDFNNLLTSVIGNLSMVELYARSGKNFSQALANAGKATYQTRDLTQQLLTFSKGGSPIKKNASIPELLRETSDFILSGSKVRCEFSLPNNLWAVEVDEGQISQVINNLVINASQAMPHGGIIKVCAENIAVGANNGLSLKARNYVKISVQDQGSGIPREYLSKIFDPYFTTKEKGSGLGLATSYSIIKKHGGYITVESEVGVGTTFYLYLPASQKGIPIGEDEKEGIYFGHGKILLMDDRESIRDMAGEMLSYFGYEVEAVGEGAEAIKLYKKAKEAGQPFDAVILDLIVPGGMGGEEVIQKLLEIDPQVKAIVSSGYSNDPIMSEYKQYGFSEVVTKPYDVKKLSETLQKVIKNA